MDSAALRNSVWTRWAARCGPVGADLDAIAVALAAEQIQLRDALRGDLPEVDVVEEPKNDAGIGWRQCRAPHEAATFETPDGAAPASGTLQFVESEHSGGLADQLQHLHIDCVELCLHGAASAMSIRS